MTRSKYTHPCPQLDVWQEALWDHAVSVLLPVLQKIFEHLIPLLVVVSLHLVLNSPFEAHLLEPADAHVGQSAGGPLLRLLLQRGVTLGTGRGGGRGGGTEGAGVVTITITTPHVDHALRPPEARRDDGVSDPLRLSPCRLQLPETDQLGIFVPLCLDPLAELEVLLTAAGHKAVILSGPVLEQLLKHLLLTGI